MTREKLKNTRKHALGARNLILSRATWSIIQYYILPGPVERALHPRNNNLSRATYSIVYFNISYKFK